MAGAIAAAVLALDVATKAAVRDLVVPNGSVPLVPGVVWLTHVQNPGAAFGMLGGLRFVFIGISAVVICAVVAYLARGTARSWWTVAALGLLAGGSAGNLIDRVSLGRVTDFVDFRWFPVFNVADAAISVGVAIILVAVLFTPDDKHAAGEAGP